MKAQENPEATRGDGAAPTPDVLLDALLRFDNARDYAGLFQFIVAAKGDAAGLLRSHDAFVAEGRFQAAFLIAKLLAGFGVIPESVAFGRAVGGVIFVNPGDEEAGIADLERCLGAMAGAARAAFRDRFALPGLGRARAAVGEDAARIAKLDRIARMFPKDRAAAKNAPARPAAAGGDPWQALTDELDLWVETGRAATFWWRDDDATRPSAHLERLIAIAGPRPVCLAVIPGSTQPELAKWAAERRQLTILQHGWLHDDHAQAPGAGVPSSEYPGHRPRPDVRQELLLSRAALIHHFGVRALPVLVPPWGMFDDGFLNMLADCGITWISTGGARRLWDGRGRVRDINPNIDLIDWDVANRWAGDAGKLEAICAHLRARRTGEVAAWEPTGILTHHALQSPESLRFLDQFLRVLDRHGNAVWLHGNDLFSSDLESTVHPARRTELEAVIGDFDQRGDFGGLVEYLLRAPVETGPLLFNLYKLLIGGRSRAAFVVAKLLVGRSVDNPTVDLARAIGGIQFGNAEDETEGRRRFAASFGRLPPDKRDEFRRSLAEPALNAAAPADPVQAKRLASLRAIFEPAAPARTARPRKSSAPAKRGAKPPTKPIAKPAAKTEAKAAPKKKAAAAHSTTPSQRRR